MIVAAAIRQHGKVYSVPAPGRHHNVIYRIARIEGKYQPDAEQGFLTEEGIFVDRIEAARIAMESKQIEQLNWPPNLFSEDLW